ncbi:unnamed protein product [Schistocephalus solidus]|uniref:Transmembrane protein n=1 Tax=Schistocephalus solidus TaxID=70667 RepID=A0A183T7U1_SCHSO|nr:unnamed protein product [Schistocephalus solidus]
MTDICFWTKRSRQRRYRKRLPQDITAPTTNPTINVTEDEGAELEPQGKKPSARADAVIVDNRSRMNSHISDLPPVEVGRRLDSEDSDEEDDEEEEPEEVESDILRQGQFLRIRGLSRLYTQSQPMDSLREELATALRQSNFRIPSIGVMRHRLSLVSFHDPLLNSLTVNASAADENEEEFTMLCLQSFIRLMFLAFFVIFLCIILRMPFQGFFTNFATMLTRHLHLLF